MNGEKKESNGVGEGGNPTRFASILSPCRKCSWGFSCPGWSFVSRTPLGLCFEILPGKQC